MAQKLAIGKGQAEANKARPNQSLQKGADRPILVRTRLALGSDASVGLAVAPAGYGKTTLLRQWTEHARARAKAWLSLGPLHRDYERFCKDLKNALAQVGCEAPVFSGRPDEDGMASAERLGKVRGGLFLVLDDYDQASSPLVDRFMRSLLGHVGAASQIALAMGRQEHVGAEALAARGSFKLVRAQELAFQDQEAMSYCARWLDPEEACALNHWTQGWPGAIGLVERALKAGQAKSWRACAPELEAYVLEETFEPLEPALKQVLVQTALAPSLSEAAINGICARGDGSALVLMLARSQGLVWPHPEGDGLCRHRLLKSVARAQFSLLPQAERAHLITNTVAFLAEGGALSEALTLAAAARDPHDLAAIDRGLKAMSWSAEALKAGQKLHGQSPEALKAAPRLRLISALARGQDHAEALYAFLPIAGDDEALCAQLFCAALADDAGVSALGELEPNNTELGSKIWPSAFVLNLRASRMTKAKAWARLGEELREDPATAERKGAGEKSGEQGHAWPLARLGAALCGLAEARPAELLTMGKAAPQWLVSAAALEAGKLNSGEIAIDAVMQNFRDWPQFAPDILLEAARANGFLGGDFNEAAAWARARGWARAERALIGESLSAALRRGDLDGAGAFVRKLKVAEEAELPISAHLALAAYALARRSSKEALARLETIMSQPDLAPRLRLRALALKTRAHHVSAEHDQAVRAIVAGLEICKVSPMCATWFEDGTDIWEALSAHGARLGQSGQAEQALEVIAKLAVARPLFEGGPALEAASKEEAALLSALAKKGGRAQAAQALKLSENTVKFYLKRLFKKWRVSDWRLAVQVNRQLKKS